MKSPTHSIATRCITTEAASAACMAAVAHARTLGLRINVAVCDAGGTPMAFLRMPGAFLHSVEIAQAKARTSAGFGMATSGWAKAVEGDEMLRIGLNARPGLVMFGGGLPIREQGELIGGIGVSGASAEQDEACARAALQALGLDDCR